MKTSLFYFIMPEGEARIFTDNSWIQKIRTGKGWTRAELAAKIGVGKTKISEWENGRQEPNAWQLKKLLDLFREPSHEEGV